MIMRLCLSHQVALTVITNKCIVMCIMTPTHTHTLHTHPYRQWPVRDLSIESCRCGYVVAFGLPTLATSPWSLIGTAFGAAYNSREESNSLFHSNVIIISQCSVTMELVQLPAILLNIAKFLQKCHFVDLNSSAVK